MIITGLCFYMFSAVIIASAVMVILSRNPVHSVLFLILAFLNSAGLFVLLGAEFLAMILVIVYVGAVAVLFMFVVMMLNVNFSAMRAGVLQYLPTGGMIGLVLLAELIFVISAWQATPAGLEVLASPTPINVTNTKALGDLLYTKYFYLFQAAGIILLIAMIGAMVLTLRKREGVRRQRVAQQVGRKRQESVEIKKVTPRSGL
ncbi:MAG TPA: NADH-quinone oxidoreductase subunit J [Alphaproteobacteria bacterium]|nr:NADH-quinone oxidoreductase subunit J [Alphaproteobacteria bacterium]